MARSDTTPNREDPTRQKVDAALYPTDEAPAQAIPVWDSMALFVEFKRSVADDPFNDQQPQDAPQAIPTKAQDTQGQLISYALKIFQTQHRTCLFSVVVADESARILRWDRSGGIVTDRFNYVDEPKKLCQFLLAFSQASLETQGYDTTVARVLPESEEYKLMEDLASDARQLKVRDYAREYFKDSISSKHKRWKLSVDTSRDDETRMDLLIGYAHDQCSSVVGRATRMFVALRYRRADDGKLVADRSGNDPCPFVALKDTWRVQSISYEGVQPVNSDEAQCADNKVAQSVGSNVACLVDQDGARSGEYEESQSVDYEGSQSVYDEATQSIDCEAAPSVESEETPSPHSTTAPSVDSNKEAQPNNESAHFDDDKDAVQSVDKEGDIIHRLMECKVQNVPTVVSQGDVLINGEPQVTKTDWKFAELSNTTSWRQNSFRSHVHYRMVELEVCQRLSEFKNGRELVKVGLDCLTGMCFRLCWRD